MINIYIITITSFQIIFFLLLFWQITVLSFLYSVHLGMSDDKNDGNEGKTLKLRNKRIIKRDDKNDDTKLEKKSLVIKQNPSSSLVPVVSIVDIEKVVVNAGIVIANLNEIIDGKNLEKNNENLIKLTENNSDNQISEINGSIENIEIKMSLNIDHFLKIVPEFDGTSSQLHKFLRCCDLIYKPLLKVPDKATFLDLVASKLNKRAYEIIKYNTFDTWEELRIELIKQFEVHKSVEQLQIELVQARQKSNESILEFSNRIEQLLSLLNDACIAREGVDAKIYINNLNSGTALRSFIDGLKSDKIQNVVKSCRFKSLKDAVDQATEEEISLSKNNSDNSNQSTKCQWCNKRGHIASNCFSLKNKTNTVNSNANIVPSTSTNANANTNSDKLKKLFCNYCKRKGHSIDTCFRKNNKIKSESQSSENSKPLGQEITTSQVGNL